jgi:hypothetical protein
MIKRIFILVCAILLSISCISFVNAGENPEKIIFLTLNYKDNALMVKDIAWGRGFVPQFTESDFEAGLGLEKAALKIYSSENKLLYESYFYVENKIFQDTIDEETGELKGGILELDNVNLTVTAPYYDNIGKIEVHSEYNDIELEHVDITKEMKVPVWEEKSDETEETTDEKTEYKNRYENIQESQGAEENAAADEDKNGGKKSFFLTLIGIIDKIFYYIFG